METPLNKKTATWTAAIAALGCVSSLQAHHSSSMFDIATSHWIKGTVVRYERVNPHAIIVMEERSADGQVQRWTVEGPSLHRLDGSSAGKDFLKAGDVIEVCGFAFRKDLQNRRALPSLHGHLLVMPDGKMRSWGPYGKLENCIRPNDPTQAWLDLLNTDSRAWQAWCRSRAMTTLAATSSRAVADEINGRMATPCH